MVLRVPAPIPIKAIGIRNRCRRLDIGATQDLLDSNFDSFVPLAFSFNVITKHQIPNSLLSVDSDRNLRAFVDNARHMSCTELFPYD